MSPVALLAIGVVFAVTAIISVVTGGTSLITVPVMIQLGIEPRTAVATNMFVLTFLSAGGALPFLRSGTVPRERLPVLITLTLISSTLGALLLLITPAKSIPLIVAIAMIVVAVFSLAKRNAGISKASTPLSPSSRLVGYVLAFLLGVYGGFFSGGYVTLLTAAFIHFLDMTFVEAVAITKVLNIFSSLVASIVFAAQGLITWNVAIGLSVVSFCSAFVGGAIAGRLGNLWLRRIFIGSVIVLAMKSLLLDVWMS